MKKLCRMRRPATLMLAIVAVVAWWPLRPLESSCLADRQLDEFVGQVPLKCCKPGNRVGCAPPNLNQTGCVDINSVYPNCSRTTVKTMDCTTATCSPAGPEDQCMVTNRVVKHNRCRGLGRITTVGCPPDQWQCDIELTKYTTADAPTSVIYVCFAEQSTICSYSYSVCD